MKVKTRAIILPLKAIRRMRALLVLLLLLAALAIAWADWQATIGEGFAFRPSSIEAALARIAPGAAETLFGAWRGTQLPYLWEPVGATFAALPAALVLAGLALLLWVTRRRRR
jgi:hypothetical protein